MASEISNCQIRKWCHKKVCFVTARSKVYMCSSFMSFTCSKEALQNNFGMSCVKTRVRGNAQHNRKYFLTIATQTVSAKNWNSSETSAFLVPCLWSAVRQRLSQQFMKKNKTRSLFHFHFHFQAHGAVKRSALATNSQIGMQLAQNLVRRYHGYLLPWRWAPSPIQSLRQNSGPDSEHVHWSILGTMRQWGHTAGPCILSARLCSIPWGLDRCYRFAEARMFCRQPQVDGQSLEGFLKARRLSASGFWHERSPVGVWAS